MSFSETLIPDEVLKSMLPFEELSKYIFGDGTNIGDRIIKWIDNIGDNHARAIVTRDAVAWLLKENGIEVRDLSMVTVPPGHDGICLEDVLTGEVVRTMNM